MELLQDLIFNLSEKEVIKKFEQGKISIQQVNDWYDHHGFCVRPQVFSQVQSVN